jgi:hypothetical protein
MVGKRADPVLGNGVTGVGYGYVAGGGIFHIAELQNVLTVLLHIYQSRCQLTVIPAVVRLLYQHYAHIRSKHNFIYNSVYIKYGG